MRKKESDENKFSHLINNKSRIAFIHLQRSLKGLHFKLSVSLASSVFHHVYPDNDRNKNVYI